jgi:hypothetical protein
MPKKKKEDLEGVDEVAEGLSQGEPSADDAEAAAEPEVHGEETAEKAEEPAEELPKAKEEDHAEEAAADPEPEVEAEPETPLEGPAPDLDESEIEEPFDLTKHHVFYENNPWAAGN